MIATDDFPSHRPTQSRTPTSSRRSTSYSYTDASTCAPTRSSSTSTTSSRASWPQSFSSAASPQASSSPCPHPRLPTPALMAQIPLLLEICYEFTCQGRPAAIEDAHEEFWRLERRWLLRVLNWDAGALGEVKVDPVKDAGIGDSGHVLFALLRPVFRFHPSSYGYVIRIQIYFIAFISHFLHPLLLPWDLTYHLPSSHNPRSIPNEPQLLLFFLLPYLYTTHCHYIILIHVRLYIPSFPRAS